MNKVFKAKLKIGELLDERINLDDFEKCFDVEIDGEMTYISIHKSSYPKSIDISVAIDEIIHRFNYTGNPKERFDMQYLNRCSSTRAEHDD
ncbi:MAG: hypothetical protein IKS19_07595 [Clostridia bacterium]|nr:hypothetical protein [Clostridia bacterium]